MSYQVAGSRQCISGNQSQSRTHSPPVTDVLCKSTGEGPLILKTNLKEFNTVISKQSLFSEVQISTDSKMLFQGSPESLKLQWPHPVFRCKKSLNWKILTAPLSPGKALLEPRYLTKHNSIYKMDKMSKSIYMVK